MVGIDTLKIIKKKFPEVKCIILSQFGERGLIKKCMELGADGYLLKDCSKQDLINAIKTVNEGGTWFEIHYKIKVTTLDKPKLSTREKEVLKFICMEFSNNDIAKKLNISKSTVNTYRARLMQKAGVENDIGLFKWALENKMTNL
ncbi:MAG: response regulator transcription factor [Bacteroidetes bacterium]|nr:response regulator transcription factor [Bacteroidota bacterium]MBL7102977.1 response regulator transcription factor [Bacteroidales bacterium]